jgi:hypothetical protein
VPRSPAFNLTSSFSVSALVFFYQGASESYAFGLPIRSLYCTVEVPHIRHKTLVPYVLGDNCPQSKKADGPALRR